MFHDMRNRLSSGTRLLRMLEERLPKGWSVSLREEPSARLDGLLTLSGPDGSTCDVALQYKTRLEARDVSRLTSRLRGRVDGRPVLVWSRFLSPRTRQLLHEAGVSYVDSTGNLRVTLDQPAVFLESSGAQRDPGAGIRPLRSLKGRAAGRAVRAVCDFREPYGIRELAARSGTSLGTLARVVELLDREAALVRDDAGRVVDVHVGNVIRRWAEDYSLPRSNDVCYCLEPRGLDAFLDGLRRTGLDYCLSGSLAGARRAPVAPTRLAVVYVQDTDAAAEALGLRPVDAGANVMVAAPYDDVVFERTWETGGLTFANLSQVAADLLTSPGRGPAEAEALLEYMTSQPEAWRA
jgi:hypothetical protein